MFVFFYSRERVPPIMLQRRASVPRINVSRATCRKPTSQPRKTLANLLPPSTTYVFRVGGNGVHMKSSKTVLEKLRQVERVFSFFKSSVMNSVTF